MDIVTFLCPLRIAVINNAKKMRSLEMSFVAIMIIAKRRQARNNLKDTASVTRLLQYICEKMASSRALMEGVLHSTTTESSYGLSAGGM